MRWRWGGSGWKRKSRTPRPKAGCPALKRRRTGKFDKAGSAGQDYWGRVWAMNLGVVAPMEQVGGVPMAPPVYTPLLGQVGVAFR